MYKSVNSEEYNEDVMNDSNETIKYLKEQITLIDTDQGKINFISNKIKEIDNEYSSLSAMQKYIEYRNYDNIKKELNSIKSNIIHLNNHQTFVNETFTDSYSPFIHPTNNKSRKRFKAKRFSIKESDCCIIS